jgi:hypothetical protein
MNNYKYKCSDDIKRTYTQIFIDTIIKNHNIDEDKVIKNYIKEFEDAKEKYKENYYIIYILSYAINIFNINEYYQYKSNLLNYLYIKIKTLLSNYNDATITQNLKDIDSLISSYTYFEKCLDTTNKSEQVNLIKIISFLNKIKKSLNIIKHQLEIIKLKNIITKYIEKDNDDVNIEKNIEKDIEYYCSNIILLIKEINSQLIIKEFKDFKLLINTPKIIEVKKKYLVPFFSKLNLSGKTKQSTKDKTDNYFLIFYKKILEIYKNKKCTYNIEKECTDIKKLLYYISRLHFIYINIHEIESNSNDPPKLEEHYFLLLKLKGGKNKNEFINYKFENKVYRRKVRYDGKKKYIILDKTRIYIKK